MTESSDAIVQAKNGRLLDAVLMFSGIGLMLIAGVLLVVFVGNNGRSATPAAQTDTAVFTGQTIHIMPSNAEQIDALAYSHTAPVVVMFGADWCPSCRDLKPVMENEARQAGGEFLLVEVDVDDCPDLADDYGIRNIPTVIAFVNEKQADRFLGARSETYVHQFISDLPTPSQ